MRKKYLLLFDSKDFNIIDKILFSIFKEYTYKVYSAGTKNGYHWE